MRLWWLLILGTIWDSSRGEELKLTTENNVSEEGPPTINDTDPHPTATLKSKRGISIGDWNNKHTNAYRNTKKIPKFSSWGGKRSPSPAGFEEEDEASRIGCQDWDSLCRSEGAAGAYSDYSTEGEGERDGRFREDKRRFSSWGGKRAQRLWDQLAEEKRKFSSWGGKRNGEPEDWSQLDKRGKFYSWTGKRDVGPEYYNDFDQDTLSVTDEAYKDQEGKRGFAALAALRRLPDNRSLKRTKFFSWNGKRDPDNRFESNENKRMEFSGDQNLVSIPNRKGARFSSWAGKRSDPDETGIEGAKRAKFYSWNGKRSDYLGQTDLTSLGEDKRAKFSSWGGKRNADSDAVWSLLEGNKRAKFSSWGGKRSADSVLSDKRAKFSSWGGKRAGFPDFGGSSFDENKRAKFSSWSGKRSGEEANDFNPIQGYKRARFSSWNGKRSANENYDNDDIKRTRFSSWAGKRNGQEKEPCPPFTEGINNDKYNLEECKEVSTLWNDREGKQTDSQSEKENEDADPTEIEKIKQLCDSLNLLNEIDFPPLLVKKDPAMLATSRFDNNYWKRKPVFSSWGGKRNALIHSLIPEYDRYSNAIANICDELETNDDWNGEESSEDRGPEKEDETSQDEDNESANVNKRATKSEIFGGKRRTPFSSWGGKRSDTVQQQGHDIRKRSVQKKLNDEKFNEINKYSSVPDVYSWNNKRSPAGTKKNVMTRYYTKNLILKDGAWSALRPIRRGSNFYPWGGKRSLTS